MTDERLNQPNRYLPPDSNHTQAIVNSQSGEHIGTRFWAPFDNPDELVDENYWFFLFRPDARQPIQAAVIANAAGRRRLVWSEGISPQQLLTQNERKHTLLVVHSAVVDQEVAGHSQIPTRWIRAYANGEKEEEGASLIAGAFTRVLVESNIDHDIIYTAVAIYEDEETNIHILTDEVL